MANQYNDAIPAVANQIAADIPDIQETLGFFKDCFGAVATGWSATVTTGLHINDVYFWPGGGTTKLLFYADTAPTGWTLITTTDDKAVMVTKGSGAGGESGGGAHSTGSWTQTTHNHQWLNDRGALISQQSYNSAGTVADITYETKNAPALQITSTTSGPNQDHYTTKDSPANTWRPAAYCFIIASLD
jgi:hypothetical protein